MLLSLGQRRKGAFASAGTPAICVTTIRPVTFRTQCAKRILAYITGPTAGNNYGTLRVIQPLDLVILSTGGSRTLVMEVTGDYEYVPEKADSFPHQAHQRKATATYLNPNSLWTIADRCAPDYNVRWTLIRCARDVSETEIAALTGKE